MQPLGSKPLNPTVGQAHFPNDFSTVFLPAGHRQFDNTHDRWMQQST